MRASFAQISDPHLTNLASVAPGQLLSKRLLGYISWRQKRRAEHQPRVLSALQQDLQGQQLAQLLITGDLTHIGLPGEFEQAALWLRSLGDSTDIALVPGNHDRCVEIAWEDSFRHWQAYMSSDPDSGPASSPSPEQGFPSLRVREGIAFIGLSSAVATAPFMATGTLGASQLERLRETLLATADLGLFRVVYLHHPPLPGTEKWRKRLTDAAQLQSVLQECGAELVLHGHGHRARQQLLKTRVGEVLVVAVPSASALGLHGADVAQYNQYYLAGSGKRWELEINPRCYSDDSGKFSAGTPRRVQVIRE